MELVLCRSAVVSTVCFLMSSLTGKRRVLSLSEATSTWDRDCVKSRSSRLKSDGGSGREMEVSHRGGLDVQQRYKSGGLSKYLA